MLQNLIPRLLSFVPASLWGTIIGRPDSPGRFATMAPSLFNRLALPSLGRSRDKDSWKVIGCLSNGTAISFAILSSARRVVKQLRGSPWFLIAAFMILRYAGLLLIPITYAGIQTYEEFVLNAYLWLLLGILFRLPALAASAQFAAVQPGAPVAHFLGRSAQKPVHQPWMR